MLENAFWAGVMDKPAFPHKTFHHRGLAPGAEPIWNLWGRCGLGRGRIGRCHDRRHSQKHLWGLSMFKTMKSTFMLGWVLVGLFLVLPVNGWAGDDEEDQPRLKVSAEGKLNVPPDKAVLSFAVETVGEKLAKVQEENQERMARVLKECQQLEIASKFIQTTSLNVIPEYPPPPRRSSGGSLEQTIPRIIGYRVVHQVNVEVRNLDIVGKVVDRVLKVGANRFSGISWGLQDEQPTKLKVLQLASSKAQNKADTLAQSLKLKLVKIMKVMEGGVSVLPPAGRYRMASAAMSMEGGGEASVSAGEISVRGTVTLVYEISPQ
jgi:uncharacterized protein YggE